MSQATRILLALAAGLALGIGSAALSPSAAGVGIMVAQPIGTAWLNGLQMTIVPLVVALLITGVAASAEAARAGRIAGRALALYLAILWTVTIMAAIVMPLLLDFFPLPADSAAALRTSLGTAGPVGAVPPFADFFVSMIPTNPVTAAANSAFLPLTVFTLVFAFAVARLPGEPRRRLTDWFRALADAMLIMIGWMLWLAPIGVLALAYVVGARAGTSAFGALLHYVLIVSVIGSIVWASAYPVAVFGGRIPLGRFARAALPAQAVAISTQSSLASLPAMLRGAEQLGVPVAISGVTLPLAVAVFRATSPAMNLAVAIYIAYWFGVPLAFPQLAAGVAVAAITTLGSVSLPGQISFVTSIAPIGLAMGIPIEPLGLLVAVETIPDLFRTVGNVTMDIATTATISARSGVIAATESDALLQETQP